METDPRSDDVPAPVKDSDANTIDRDEQEKDAGLEDEAAPDPAHRSEQ